ncbi:MULTISPECIES: hypothetical protein [unclassified Mycolicibacterium]|uniref:hypothetical protein n=1 Tax=unclassified Mycolicibacterium TaxID=2636767 RepID=UPI001F4C2CA2|nr:hypothetical protein [Mycolicibacterium sp. YH-1]UNB51546.1 hypothetical protein L0M16_27125 [Mycolicibacterium sp. YH-1]
MSVLNLPEPGGWREAQRKWVWAAAFMVVACVWLSVLGIQATVRGNYLTTVIVVGWVAPMILGLVVLVWASVSPTSLRASVDSAGTKFRGDIRVATLLLIGGLLFIPGGLMYVIFVPRGQIDLPMSRGFQVFSPILMASALFIVVGGLISIVRRKGAGYLRLSPSGIENANVKVTTFVAWDDVIGIKASAEKPTRKALVLCLKDSGEEIIEGLTAYVPGGGLYWMIRHYWLHPDERTELVDGRALERLKAGRFNVDDTDDSRM